LAFAAGFLLVGDSLAQRLYLSGHAVDVVLIERHAGRIAEQHLSRELMTDDLHGRIEDLIAVCVIEVKCVLMTVVTGFFVSVFTSSSSTQAAAGETWSSTMITSLSLTITDELPTTASEPVPTA
jgi:hypothetical protein